MPGDHSRDRLHGFFGYTSADKGAQKDARKATRSLELAHERARRDAERAEEATLQRERRTAGFLPKSGERGPLAGRSYRRLRIPPHQATSEVLSAAYPFLAEEGLGSDGVLIGQDAWSGTAFCFDPWVLYQRKVITDPNICLFGHVGSGKSSLAKSLAARCIAFGRRVYVAGDPKGEWTAVCKVLGGQTIALGVGNDARLNPLDEGPRPSGVADEAWQVQVRRRRQELLYALAQPTLGRQLRATERTALDAALTAACRASSTPTLPMVVDAMFDPDVPSQGSTVEELANEGREVAHALARLVRGDLAGLFDGPSTVRFDPSLPMLTLDLSHIAGSDTMIGLVSACTSAWMEAVLHDPAGGQRLVIYDEAWRLMAQPALLARMQAQWKLSRAWGLANLMIVHRLSDLDAVGDAGSEARGLAQGLLRDTATRILYNEPYDEAQAAGKVLGLSPVEIRQLPELEQGEGLWRINERSFVVRHTRTRHEEELFNTDDRMLGVG